jgi:hypothetical protein
MRYPWFEYCPVCAAKLPAYGFNKHIKCANCNKEFAIVQVINREDINNG